MQESGCHLFTLLGAAGVGKSRLVAELLAAVGDGATVAARSLPALRRGDHVLAAGRGADAGRRAAQHVLDRLGTGGAATPEELFWEVRRLLESLAAERPVILHVDDLQWAEPMLLDLLDHVADLSRGAPILLLCTARPELLEDRPAWGGGKLNATTVLLEPLDAAESEALLDQLGDGLAPDARARVIAASEGNPLFLEEMAALARERGDGGGPADDPGAARGATRAARESRSASCSSAARSRARSFTASRSARLASEPSPARVEQRLAGLVRKELIRPHSADDRGRRAFRFRHLLIRDAAYDGLPKATRAELHERFADWLEDDAPRASPSSTRSPAGTWSRPSATNASWAAKSTRSSYDALRSTSMSRAGVQPSAATRTLPEVSSSARIRSRRTAKTCSCASASILPNNSLRATTWRGLTPSCLTRSEMSKPPRLRGWSAFSGRGTRALRTNCAMPSRRSHS